VNKENEIFDIAIIDVQMPGVDGTTLAHQIRKIEKCKHIKFIMLCDVSKTEDAGSVLDKTFHAAVNKPIKPSDLFNALAITTKNTDALQQSSSHRNRFVETQTPNDWPENTRLLLVEDVHVNQLVAKGILANIGSSTDIAANGLEAINSLRSALESQPYTHILMDCQMPEMDGYEASQKIRAGAAGNRYIDIPIIAMTANAMKGDKNKCLAAGMNDYLSKPIDQSLLKKKLQVWVV